VRRIIAKAISWELSSNVAGLALAYWWFGNFGTCLAFTVVCIGMKITLFIPHERLWK
jgi:uncharacterized membrane protein